MRAYRTVTSLQNVLSFAVPKVGLDSMYCAKFPIVLYSRFEFADRCSLAAHHDFALFIACAVLRRIGCDDSRKIPPRIT